MLQCSVCVCVYGDVSQGVPQIIKKHPSADEEVLLGNRTRHGMGGKEREGAENRGSLRERGGDEEVERQ